MNVNLKFKPDWFKKKTAVGLVPVLEKGDKIVCDSAVCDDYLDDIFRHKPLYPSDAYEKAQRKMLMERFSKVISISFCKQSMLSAFVLSFSLFLKTMQQMFRNRQPLEFFRFLLCCTKYSGHKTKRQL